MSIDIVANSVKDYRNSKQGGEVYSVIRPIVGCAAGQGMVFVLSVLNRVYNFVRVCSNEQGIASTIGDDFICLMKFFFTPCKYKAIDHSRKYHNIP